MQPNLSFPAWGRALANGFAPCGGPRQPQLRVESLTEIAGSKLVTGGRIGAETVESQEADRVADQVMRMSEPTVRRQPMDTEEDEVFQAKAPPGGTPEVMRDLDSRIDALRGGGRPRGSSLGVFLFAGEEDLRAARRCRRVQQAGMEGDGIAGIEPPFRR